MSDQAKMMLVIDPDALRDIVRAAVRAELAASQPPEYLSPEQAAELIGCKATSLYTYVSRDGLPVTKLSGLNRYPRAALLEWLDARTTGPRPKRRNLRAVK